MPRGTHVCPEASPHAGNHPTPDQTAPEAPCARAPPPLEMVFKGLAAEGLVCRLVARFVGLAFTRFAAAGGLAFAAREERFAALGLAFAARFAALGFAPGGRNWRILVGRISVRAGAFFFLEIAVFGRGRAAPDLRLPAGFFARGRFALPHV